MPILAPSVRRMRQRLDDLRAGAAYRIWDAMGRWGAIGPTRARARRFGAFGEGSVMCFPWTALYGERWMRIGSHTMIGPQVSLTVGYSDTQVPIVDPALVIGDRCLINKGTAIVCHFSIEIGDDVFTGHNCYITDQNHAYEDLGLPIGAQAAPEKAVRVGAGSWLGHGVVVLPGVTIGEHVTVAAGSVVTKDLPARCVAAGTPARVLRLYREGEGWVPVDAKGRAAR